MKRLLTQASALIFIAIATATPLAAQSQDDYDRQIEQLMNHPAVRSALDHIVETDDQTMEDLMTLTQIPAPPFMEDERGAAFLQMMIDLGVDSSWTDEVGNVIGLRRGSGTGEVLAIAGHLDTVFPPETDVTIRISGDTLFAPGIADDTRGLATVLAVLRAMNESNIRTEADILFIGNVGEEGIGDLRGVKHLFRDGGPRIDHFISVDGTSANGITHMGLGSHRYRVTFKGPGGHSWGAFGLANPAHAMGRAIRYFQDGAGPYTANAPFRTSYNVGRIGGGTSVNSVPFESWMEIDMRSEGDETLDAVDAILQGAIQRALAEENALRTRGEPLTVDVDMIGDRPSGEVAIDHPFVEQTAAVTRALGLFPGFGRSSTDSNIPISLGIPAVTIGGGGQGFGAHSLDEWFRNEDGALGVQRVMLVVLAQVGLAQTS
ncbi:MAG: M20/M25/M40 family metallo-hydrolase [Gemmatimonadota bacterium]|nr:M20/M25/M40 family metallo-hydrolase [Gemmatimonadota bacterium]MDE3004701.1 M20/M25/M40 family metallo-hydrolase [Gemmatimonadota bacterium]MDE3013960.1 M20/M25/M40 family metallo-hydrolase [Gemmatimonadota bacterium]